MNKQIIEEAADWLVEFGSGEAEPGTKTAFDAWLRKSPEHVRVYLELLPMWEDAAIPLPACPMTADELIALAQGEGTVVPLERAASIAPEKSGTSSTPASRTPEATERTARAPSAAWRFAAAASVGIVAVGAAIAVWVQLQAAPTYATGVGQNLSVTLSDGSSLELNTQSRVRVKFTLEARDVELLQGQALFRVAKDRSRPFIVSSGAIRVRAVGTEFNVYRKTTGTTVTVIEGSVAAVPAIGSPKVLLVSGEQMTLIPAAASTHVAPQHVDVTQATAWTHGRLIFEDTPLTEVADEFNRYNERRMVIDDASLKDFHVNGSFRSSDPTALLSFLKEQPGVSVHESASVVHISRD